MNKTTKASVAVLATMMFGLAYLAYTRTDTPVPECYQPMVSVALPMQVEEPVDGVPVDMIGRLIKQLNDDSPLITVAAKAQPAPKTPRRPCTLCIFPRVLGPDGEPWRR